MKLPLWRVADLTGAEGGFYRESIADSYSIEIGRAHV